MQKNDSSTVFGEYWNYFGWLAVWMAWSSSLHSFHAWNASHSLCQQKLPSRERFFFFFFWNSLFFVSHVLHHLTSSTTFCVVANHAHPTIFISFCSNLYTDCADSNWVSILAFPSNSTSFVFKAAQSESKASYKFISQTTAHFYIAQFQFFFKSCHKSIFV